MRLPQRSDQHIIESESFTVLRQVLPREWVIRELSERDYGIDAYVEIVGGKQVLSGDMTALQLKGKKVVKFVEGRATFSGIKRETLNYWLSLPVPVFLCVACIGTGKCYWANINGQNREGKFEGKSKTISVSLFEEFDFSELGLLAFELSYNREKSWPEIENAIEKSLMLFNTLGPLVLMCKRSPNDVPCSTTIQYLVNQHYEFHRLLSKYLLGKKPENLPYWYEQNISYIKSANLDPSITIYYKVLKDLFQKTLSDYRDSIIAAYELVMESQAYYFSRQLPSLYLHLKARPHTFLAEDWYSRYFFDEYENETRCPERLYFEDFDVFDSHLDDLLRS
ncbi:protein of unknown function [Formivibrio citricus]|uniref:DUF4365 domain-containing protein n=1 Tax=Formivibrio citricus TaxID=83765 RepID=A0A1I4Z3C5_9NEIS|nr:DUF4365 domain-containing protein [Formivibrio citricus]SFN44752.1 protein of unknown function [Formivibrio citricus]